MCLSTIVYHSGLLQSNLLPNLLHRRVADHEQAGELGVACRQRRGRAAALTQEVQALSCFQLLSKKLMNALQLDISRHPMARDDALSSLMV